MKKILALFLVFALLITVAACNRADDAAGDTTTTSTTTSTGGTTTTTASSFVKPAGCVSVLEVSINPLFRLYLDAEDVVLAVECLNADAIAMEKELNVVNTKCDVAVTSLVSAANNKGFVKADTVVRLEMVESGKSNTSALMSKAESAVAGLASDLEMTFSVTVAQPTGEGATDSDANQTTLSPEHTAATEKATSTTKKTTTTTTKGQGGNNVTTTTGANGETTTTVGGNASQDAGATTTTGDNASQDAGATTTTAAGGNGAGADAEPNALPWIIGAVALVVIGAAVVLIVLKKKN